MNLILVLIMVSFYACNSDEKGEVSENVPVLIEYTMPEESEMHEGTWLYWPHQYQFGVAYRNSLDATWLEMTNALVSGEKVHIAAYDIVEKNRILGLLNNAGVNMNNVDVKVLKTDDVWSRDGGPIYVRDKNGSLVVEDWGFNGWGNKFNFSNCNELPKKIGLDQGKPVLDLNNLMIIEGGAVEIDGNGTLLATKSAILNANRNPDMSVNQAERILTKYYGVTNFIWLNGVPGLEITDMHIDGFAKFVNQNTLMTMSKTDLLEWEVPQVDIDALYAAKNKYGDAYTIVQLPLTQSNVVTTYGKNLGYKGSYANFYIANNVVLVPNYHDLNDVVANAIIQSQFPNRTVIGIDVRNLYEYGGMVHCVTQQQPAE
ncbi:agmatine deiminase family protein [Flavobacterium sp.]|uniref:agmatine deiminase family protein n=1 Tax=Flavobacterium sp. TaxID=239 RepID=UPI0040482A2B